MIVVDLRSHGDKQSVRIIVLRKSVRKKTHIPRPKTHLNVKSFGLRK